MLDTFLDMEECSAEWDAQSFSFRGGGYTIETQPGKLLFLFLPATTRETLRSGIKFQL